LIFLYLLAALFCLALTLALAADLAFFNVPLEREFLLGLVRDLDLDLDLEDRDLVRDLDLDLDLEDRDLVRDLDLDLDLVDRGLDLVDRDLDSSSSEEAICLLF
jgi:hypothetical protein